MFTVLKGALIMPYDFDYSEGGYVVRFKGNVTIEELNDANGEIQGHSDFDFHNYQIVDLLKADLSSVNEKAALIPAATDSVASETRKNVKVAVVASESHALSVANSYVKLAREMSSSWEFDVFSTYEDALKWAKT